MLNEDGAINGETRLAVGDAVRAWDSNEPGDHENHVYWATRNFKSHPRHQHLFETFVKEVLAEEPAAKAKPMVRPRYRSRIDSGPAV